MAFVITCTIMPGAIETLTALRARHLDYIRAHCDEILFGGPARSADGLPETMIIVVKTTDRAAAESLIMAEPYTASKKAFSEIVIRPWSQVLPEPFPGALDKAIAEQLAAHPPGAGETSP